MVNYKRHMLISTAYNCTVEVTSTSTGKSGDEERSWCQHTDDVKSKCKKGQQHVTEVHSDGELTEVFTIAVIANMSSSFYRPYWLLQTSTKDKQELKYNYYL